MGTRIPWSKIRDRYIQDETTTLDGLCVEFGVGQSTIHKKCRDQGWVKKRALFQAQVETRATEIAAKNEAKRRANMIKVADSMKALGLEGLARTLKDMKTDPKKRIELNEVRLFIKDATEIERRALGIADVVAMSDDELNQTILHLTAELAPEPAD